MVENNDRRTVLHNVVSGVFLGSVTFLTRHHIWNRMSNFVLNLVCKNSNSNYATLPLHLSLTLANHRLWSEGLPTGDLGRNLSRSTADIRVSGGNCEATRALGRGGKTVHHPPFCVSSIKRRSNAGRLDSKAFCLIGEDLNSFYCVTYLTPHLCPIPIYDPCLISPLLWECRSPR